jgi:hypothetical protein
MIVKSAAAAASLGMSFPFHFEPAHAAAAAVEFSDIATAKPGSQPFNRDHGGNAHLAGDDGRMGQEAAVLDKQARCGRKQYDPTGIRARRDKDFARFDHGVTRIENDSRLSADDARTAADAFAFFALGLCRIGRDRFFERVADVHHTVRLEAFGRWIFGPAGELLPANANELLEIRGDSRSLDEAQRFLGLK